jgi:hypothetical protein
MIKDKYEFLSTYSYYLYLYTYTGVQHHLNIRWCLWHLIVTWWVSLVEQEPLILPGAPAFTHIPILLSTFILWDSIKSRLPPIPTYFSTFILWDGFKTMYMLCVVYNLQVWYMALWLDCTPSPYPHIFLSSSYEMALRLCTCCYVLYIIYKSSTVALQIW